ncbi:MAG: YIP1 family protein [Calditrichaeota bacterium]|nr:MAG: YIP1 family protein [Calditrichota bacterium]
MSDMDTTQGHGEEQKKQDAKNSEELEEILKGLSETESPESQESLSLLQRIVGVFTNPGRVFAYLRTRPDFLIPLIIAVLMSIFSSYMVYDIALDDSIQKIEQSEKFSDEQKERIIDQTESRRYGTWRTVSIVGFPLVGVVLIIVLVTLVFWFVGNVVLGGKVTFKQLLSVYCYSWLIYSIPGSLVSVWLIIKYETLKIPISLAALLPENMEGTGLYRFMESIDPFTIWFLIVLGIGFATVYQFSRKKGLMTVFSVWLLYVLLFKVALGAFFSQFGG